MKERYSWNFTKCCFLTILTLLTILIFVIIFVFFEINGLSQVRKYPTMWEYGQHYCVESLDVKDDNLIVEYWLISSNLVEKAQKIRILLKGIYNILKKSKILLSWIIALLNVVFLSVDGMKHLRGHKYMIPIMDCFL